MTNLKLTSNIINEPWGIIDLDRKTIKFKKPGTWFERYNQVYELFHREGFLEELISYTMPFSVMYHCKNCANTEIFWNDDWRDVSDS